MKKSISIPVVILRTKTGYSGHSPLFDGCAVSDRTIDKTLNRLREALEFHLEGEKLVKNARARSIKTLKTSFDDYGTDAFYATLDIAAQRAHALAVNKPNHHKPPSGQESFEFMGLPDQIRQIDMQLHSSYNCQVTGLQGKRWYFFVWDEDNTEHLHQHRISPEEAEQVFFNRYVITPNKKKHGPRRYRIDGKTDASRSLRVIFEDLGSSVARVITGWDL